MGVRRHQATPPTLAADADERIVTTDFLLERVPLDRTTIWRMARDGRFPKPIQLTPARIGWRWSSVLAWLREREENPIETRAYFGRGDKGAGALR